MDVIHCIPVMPPATTIENGAHCTQLFFRQFLIIPLCEGNARVSAN